MRKLLFILLGSYLMTSCRSQFPIIAGYQISDDTPMDETYNSKFGLFVYSKDYTEFIAGSVKHVYFNDELLIAQQDSLCDPTWYIVQPKKYNKLNGPWDDSIEGPLSTSQRDSILDRLNVRLEDLRHNDYTTWQYPRD